MNVRETLRALEGRLDDVRLERGWRSLEHTIHATRVAPAWWRSRLLAGAVVLVIAIAIGASAAITQERAASRPFMFDAMAAEPGQQRTIERRGVALTLIGPGSATVSEGGDGTLHVRLDSGTLVGERASDAVPVTVLAALERTVTRDRRFAVRVEANHVVFGAGEHARAIVERATLMAPGFGEVETHVPPAGKTAAEPVRATPARRTAPARTAAVTESPGLRASELYRRAEAALAARDPARAHEHLERLLREFPDDALVDAARYDLALLAHAAGDDARALALLDAIVADGRDRGVRSAAEALARRLQRAE